MFAKLIDTLASVAELAIVDPVPESTSAQNSTLYNIWIESFHARSFSLLNAHLKQLGYTEPSSLSDFVFLFNEFISTMPASMRDFFGRMLYLGRPSAVVATRVPYSYILWSVYLFGKKLRVLKLNRDSMAPDSCCMLDKRVISSELAYLILAGRGDEKLGTAVISIYVNSEMICPFKLERLLLCLRCLECQLMLYMDDEAVINNAVWLTDTPVNEVYIDKLTQRRETGQFVRTANFEVKIWLLGTLIALFCVLFTEFILMWVGTGQIVALKKRLTALEATPIA